MPVSADYRPDPRFMTLGPEFADEVEALYLAPRTGPAVAP